MSCAIQMETDMGKTSVAAKFIAKNQQVYEFKGTIQDKPSMHTIQVGDSKHLSCTSGPEYTAHSCDPNTKAVFHKDEKSSWVEFIALKDINSNEPITFDYNTTEWDMCEKFKCKCNTTKCYGTISGFKHLDVQQQEKLSLFVSPFLKSKLSTENTIELKSA